MALVVNTNVSSLVAQRNLMESKNALDTAMERLSSGKRINSAADDAAGLAISNRMESQIRGLNMAVRNANDGISLAQTAEGAMEEITNMLQRMRELAIQSSNSVNNALDRAAIDNEVQQLSAEIDRVAEQTRFNDVALLDGSFQGAKIQVGIKANESIGFDIRDLSSSSLGRVANTNGALANTQASVEGTAATTTIARLSFSGADTYTFKVEGTTVQGTLNPATMVQDLGTLATTINNNLNAANANNKVVASVSNGSIELRNTAGAGISVSAFSSTASGTATFDVLQGTGDSTFLSDAATVSATGFAEGIEDTDAGVRLKLDEGGEYSFKLNGVQVEMDGTETVAQQKAKLVTALGSGYEVLAAGEAASAALTTAAGGVAPTVAADEFLIYNPTEGVPVNITNFQANDGYSAGVQGQIRVATNDDEALLIDETNTFVANSEAGETTEFSMHFTSTTSDYEININDDIYVISGDDITAGTAGRALMAQLNLEGTYTAGGLGSLGNALTADVGAGVTGGTDVFTVEVVQNGNQITVKAADSLGDFTIAINEGTALSYAANGTGTAQADWDRDVNFTYSARGVDSDGDAVVTERDLIDYTVAAVGAGVDAWDAIDPSFAEFYVNKATDGTADPGSKIDLNTVGTALFSSAQATATKASLAAQADGTYTFKITDGTTTTGAITGQVTSGSASGLVTQINNGLTAAGLTEIVATSDPANAGGIILTRADGGKVKVIDFFATDNAGNETGAQKMIFSPNAGQGTATTLDSTTYTANAEAVGAGLAVATNVDLTFDDVTTTNNNFVSFKITDGISTAVVRRTELSATAGDVTAIQAELNNALTNAGLTQITATATNVGGVNKINFVDSDGGLIKITDFVTDNGIEARWSPQVAGQGSPTILNDDSGTASTGTAISEISVTTTGAATAALEVIDNALQDVDDERAMLGAVQNRLTHTISNLTNISTNTSAAQSRIQDADFAVEAANLAKAQVLQQAGTSMLAQANASPQYVLSLLQ